MSVPWRIIQLSDLHLFKDPDEILLGVKTQESFQAVLDFLKKEDEKMDLIILSGDLSQDGTAEAYQRIAKMMQVFNVPVYWVLGNHDNETVMMQHYPMLNIVNDKQIIGHNWQLVLLNSQKVGAVEGVVDPSQLEFMKKCLRENPQLFSLVLLHHQALPVGSEWLDELGLENAQMFWDSLVPFPNVKVVICGHVHQDNKKKYKNIDCYTVPSTCIQFKNQDEFSLENIPPGYRWIHLYEDGRFKTGIKRLQKYVGVFDRNARGY